MIFGSVSYLGWTWAGWLKQTQN